MLWNKGKGGRLGGSGAVSELLENMTVDINKD